MKTDLNISINSIDDARNFIKELVLNNEIYPLSLCAYYITWIGTSVTNDDRDALNDLVAECNRYMKSPTEYSIQFVSLLDFVGNEN
jgi:hypothetical protein